jgi:hypothetical protein
MSKHQHDLVTNCMGQSPHGRAHSLSVSLEFSPLCCSRMLTNVLKKATDGPTPESLNPFHDLKRYLSFILILASKRGEVQNCFLQSSFSSLPKFDDWNLLCVSYREAKISGTA